MPFHAIVKEGPHVILDVQTDVHTFLIIKILLFPRLNKSIHAKIDARMYVQQHPNSPSLTGLVEDLSWHQAKTHS